MESTRYPKQGHVSAVLGSCFPSCSQQVPLKECKLTSKYDNIKSTIDSGWSVPRVTDKFAESKANARFKKEEFFRRMKPALLAKLVEESEVQVLLLDLRDAEEYQLSHIKGAISYPSNNLKKSVNYFSADILSFINKEPERIIVIYDDDDHAVASSGNLFFEKGVDNIFILHGGVREVAGNYSFMLEGVYPKPVKPFHSKSKGTVKVHKSKVHKSVAGSKPTTPNWIRKNKILGSGLSTPASIQEKVRRPGWGFPHNSPTTPHSSTCVAGGFSPIRR